MHATEGKAAPLGATYDGRGVNFAVFSSAADSVELCLFDDDGREERMALPGRTGSVHHGYVASVGPGQRYGYRVRGPWDPARGHLCSRAYLLLDPYARAVEGDVRWDDALFPRNRQDAGPGTPASDTAPFVPKSVVIDPAFDWGVDRPPGTRLEDTVIYEVHVRGFTHLHPEVPAELRGTYAGLAHPAAVAHLTALGVTAVELLPVHQFIHRRRLTAMGLRNYWGYDPVGYFAPHHAYAADGAPGGAVREFKEMVRALHAAGLEVFLDVVFNHTGEGGADGPVLSFKGLDNKTYYGLSGGDTLTYVDLTGTQNTVNAESPVVRRMIIDSLAYWADEMHVDGFRFDLAPVLIREDGKVNLKSDFFEAIRQEPALGRAKLIAEPWDLGENGYQAGRFPAGWSEWNDRYRDDVRGYWNGRPASAEGFVRRLAGSPDIYRAAKRAPQASVNFVTCHDGFTLADLVSYEAKHNQANGEDNRDGHDDNRSWNCGVEGPTENAQVNALRERQKRNFLAALLLSRGVPMLLGGDEIGRTQRGNNNAYCQDSEISWFDWSAADRGLMEFVGFLVRLRREHPAFGAKDWLLPGEGGTAPRCAFAAYDTEGREIHAEGAPDSPPRPLQVLFTAGPHEPRAAGPGDLLVACNPTDRDATFRVPAEGESVPWVKVLDTSAGKTGNEPVEDAVTLVPHALAVLRRPPPAERAP